MIAMGRKLSNNWNKTPQVSRTFSAENTFLFDISDDRNKH